MGMFQLLVEYFKDEEGQTSTEYILLVAVVAMIVLKFKEKLNTKLNSVLDGAFGKVEGGINDF
jgi:pilus assembly protein Flp/PilA